VTESTAIDTWESLFRAQVTVLRRLHQEFPSDELSFNEYDVLFNLSIQDRHRLRMRDLNRHLLLSQPSVSRLVDRLVARGVVRKESDPMDGRGTFVCLTSEGESLFRRLAVVHARSIRHHVGNALTEEELHELRRLSDKLRRSLDASSR